MKAARRTWHGLEWDAAIAEDIPGQMVHWKANDDTKIPQDLRIFFKPALGDQGTEATIVALIGTGECQRLNIICPIATRQNNWENKNESVMLEWGQ